jgi:hypothetical protein
LEKVLKFYNMQDASEQAAWTMVANVLMNTDEAITKE